MSLHHANNSPILRGMVYLPRGVVGVGVGVRIAVRHSYQGALTGISETVNRSFPEIA